jgi:hypothetical protein
MSSRKSVPPSRVLAEALVAKAWFMVPDRGSKSGCENSIRRVQISKDAKT